MENSMAKDVITQMYAEFRLYHHYTVENWGILCSALACAVEALDKQIPEKPKLDNDNGIYETEHCPNCNRKLFPNEHHCKCGQALDWSDTK